MKKHIASIIFFTIILSGLANASDLDTADWYIYKGSAANHAYSVNYPTDWEAIVYGDDLQGFAPTEIEEEGYLFFIQEFEEQTYDQVINYYVDESTTLLKSEDIVFSSSKGDILGKHVTYNAGEDMDFSFSIFKRGSLIVTMNNPELLDTEDSNTEIVENIYNSFSFGEDWHQYIDFGEGYSFIFPAILEIANINNGVEIYNSETPDTGIFTVIKYENTSIEDVAKDAEGYSEDFKEEESIFFHGIQNAIVATYEDEEHKKDFSKIFVQNGQHSYSLSNVNIEDNFPNSNYYDQYIAEILEGFEFFDIDGEYSTYLNFPDVRDNHYNATAINSLAASNVIDGYDDGSFKPDGDINRAELTKMIVAATTDPNPETYKNCFPDVNEDWFAPYVCYAKEKEWVVGYDDGKFKPNNKINRVEAMKIVLEVLFDGIAEEELDDTSVKDVASDLWYSKYFSFADNRSLLDKQHIAESEDEYSYYPDYNISRKEVAELIYRAQNLQ